jgi:uncharacterized protein YjbI with pentapeptide repeats
MFLELLDLCRFVSELVYLPNELRYRCVIVGEMTTDEGQCTYIATKDDSSNWYGDSPTDWQLTQDTWTCPHDAISEHDSGYCVFHMDPANIPDNINETEEFVAAINEDTGSDTERNTEFVGATFGRIELNQSKIDPAHSIVLDHATFSQGLVLRDSSIGQPVSARKCHFVSVPSAENESDMFEMDGENGVIIAGEFNGSVNRPDSKLRHTANFEGSDFTGDGSVRITSEFTGDGLVNFENITVHVKGGISIGSEFSGGTVSFDGAVFDCGGQVVFTGGTFDGIGDVSFQETIFKPGELSEVIFSSTSFSCEGDVSFRESEFHGRAYFTNLHWAAPFPYVSFNSHGDVNFIDAKFYAGVDFTGANFRNSGRVKFHRTKVTGTAIFKDMTFSSDVESVGFLGASFDSANKHSTDSPTVDFSATVFDCEGIVLFYGTRFGDSVSFKNAEFLGSGDVEFGHRVRETHQKQYIPLEFDGETSFTNAKFQNEGDVVFSGANFIQEVKFRDVLFNSAGRVLFSPSSGKQSVATEIHNSISFTEAEFQNEVRFDDIAIDPEAIVSFSDAVLHQRCHFGTSDGISTLHGNFDFSGSTFHKPPNFSGEQSLNETKIQSEITDKSEEFRTQFNASFDCSEATFIDGVDLSRTNFSVKTSFEGADLSGADFSNSDLSSELSEEDRSEVIEFDGANLSDVNFSNANLSGSSLARSRLNRAEFLGTNLIGSDLYGALLGGVRINHRTSFWPSKISRRQILQDKSSELADGRWRRIKTLFRNGRRPYCVHDPRYPYCNRHANNDGTTPESELEMAAEMYGSLEQAAADNSLPTLASESFLGRKDVQRYQYWRRNSSEGRQWLMTIRSIVPNLLARYGESPWRVLLTGGLIILTCGLFYWRFDLIERATESGKPITFLEGVYFSALTFTTLGYGDYNPVSLSGQFLAVGETSLGVILLAILVFVFGRRATR